MTHGTFEAVCLSIQLHGFEVEAANRQAREQGFSSVEEFATELVRLEILETLEKEKAFSLTPTPPAKSRNVAKQMRKILTTVPAVVLNGKISIMSLRKAYRRTKC